MKINLDGFKAAISSPRETLTTVVSYLGRVFSCSCCRGRNKTSEVAAEVIKAETPKTPETAVKKARVYSPAPEDSIAGRVKNRHSK